MVTVQYRGPASALTDLISGQVQQLWALHANAYDYATALDCLKAYVRDADMFSGSCRGAAAVERRSAMFWRPLGMVVRPS